MPVHWGSIVMRVPLWGRLGAWQRAWCINQPPCPGKGLLFPSPKHWPSMLSQAALSGRELKSCGRRQLALWQWGKIPSGSGPSLDWLTSGETCWPPAPGNSCPHDHTTAVGGVGGWGEVLGDVFRRPMRPLTWWVCCMWGVHDFVGF